MENGTTQVARRFSPAGAFYLLVLFWVPWLAFSMTAGLIRSSYLRMHAEAPLPADFLVRLFSGGHPASWILGLAGVLLPLGVLLIPADRWRRGILVTSSLAIVLLISLGVIAVGVAVSAAAAIAAS